MVARLDNRSRIATFVEQIPHFRRYQQKIRVNTVLTANFLGVQGTARSTVIHRNEETAFSKVEIVLT